MEQYSLANNLNIKGIPPNVEVSDVVRKLEGNVGETITDNDIDICQRVQTQSCDKQILLSDLSGNVSEMKFFRNPER